MRDPGRGQAAGLQLRRLDAYSSRGLIFIRQLGFRLVAANTFAWSVGVMTDGFWPG